MIEKILSRVTLIFGFLICIVSSALAQESKTCSAFNIEFISIKRVAHLILINSICSILMKRYFLIVFMQRAPKIQGATQLRTMTPALAPKVVTIPR